MMTGMEDLESQTHGLVLIAYFLGKEMKDVNRQTAWKMVSLIKVLPVRFQAIHFCVESSELKPHLSLLLFALNATNRVRMRCHEGRYSASSAVIFCKEVVYPASSCSTHSCVSVL
jgi:hypothetical protein